MVTRRNVVFLFMQLTISKTVSSPLVPLILYGTAAKIEDFPFFAATEFCGGSILSERWVLTAAHCVDNRQSVANRLLFVGGERMDNSIRLTYDKIFIHPKYTKGSQWSPISNDIALLQLRTPLRFSNKVMPVKLPMQLSSNPRHVFIGRGRDETGKSSVSLMKIDVVRLSSQECTRVIGSNAYYSLLMDQSVICGKRIDGRPGVCFGDSGSPLLQNGMIVGLASFLMGRDCNNANIAYYTNVAAYVPWIKSITGLR